MEGCEVGRELPLKFEVAHSQSLQRRFENGGLEAGQRTSLRFEEAHFQSLHPASRNEGPHMLLHPVNLPSAFKHCSPTVDTQGFTFNTGMDTLGFELRAFRMRSGCDTTTPCAHVWLGPDKWLAYFRSRLFLPGATRRPSKESSPKARA